MVIFPMCCYWQVLIRKRHSCGEDSSVLKRLLLHDLHISLLQPLPLSAEEGFTRIRKQNEVWVITLKIKLPVIVPAKMSLFRNSRVLQFGHADYSKTKGKYRKQRRETCFYRLKERKLGGAFINKKVW